MEVALRCRVARVTHSGLWTKRGSPQSVGTKAPASGWGLRGGPLWVVLNGTLGGFHTSTCCSEGAAGPLPEPWAGLDPLPGLKPGVCVGGHNGGCSLT